MTKATKLVTLPDHAALVAIFRAALSGNKNFGAANRTVTGTKRQWLISPKGGRALIKGTGAPLKNTDVVHVFDLNAAGTRASNGTFVPPRGNGWRSVNLNTLSEVRYGRTVYRTA